MSFSETLLSSMKWNRGIKIHSKEAPLFPLPVRNFENFLNNLQMWVKWLLTKHISEQRRPVILKSPKSRMLFPPIFMLSDVWWCADEAAGLMALCPLAMAILLEQEQEQAGSLKSSQEALIKGSPWRSSAEGSTLTYNHHGGTRLKSGRSYWWLTYKVTAFLLRLQKPYANTVTKRRALIDHLGVLQGSHCQCLGLKTIWTKFLLYVIWMSVSSSKWVLERESPKQTTIKTLQT